MHDRELAILIGLSHSLISGPVLLRLVQALGSVEAVWAAPESLLEEYLSANQVEKLSWARKTLDIDRLWAAYQQQHIHVLPLSHPDYPRLLRLIHHPPFLLFVRGNIQVLSESRTLAMVGTRRATAYGHRVVNHLVSALTPAKPCIISGLASGIDTFAHEAALAHQLPTVAVFGTGIDTVYPKANEKLARRILEAGGALVSELPMGIPGGKHTFPNRNRIIAGLSQGTLVVEGDIGSGALITSTHALEENRLVFAVPGSIFSPASAGPNRLIQKGAIPVQDGQDMMQALVWDMEALQQPLPAMPTTEPYAVMLESLSDAEKSVFGLIGHDAVGFETLQTRQPAMAVAELNRALTMLELQGLITALPGGRYCRN